MAGSCSLKLDVARDRMAALDHTQASLAAECGVDVRTVQRWFAGQTVGVARAEQVARALRMGTSEVFRDVPEDGLKAFVRRMGLLQKLLNGRDGAVASAIRIAQEQFATALLAVSHNAHPVHGYVASESTAGWSRHGFACVQLKCDAEEAEIGLRYQLGKRFGYVAGGLWLTHDTAYLVETFQVRSMRAKRASDGSVRLWFWVTDAVQELFAVSNADVGILPCETAARKELDIDTDLGPEALCLRPSPVDLRNACLPMGFDRLTGARTGRVDVPVEWDPASLRAG